MRVALVGTDPAWTRWRAALGAAGWEVVSPEAPGLVDAVLVSPWDADVHEVVDAARKRWASADVWCVATGASARAQRLALVHGAAGMLPREPSPAAVRRVAVVAAGPRLQPCTGHPHATAVATATARAARRTPRVGYGAERTSEVSQKEKRPGPHRRAVVAAGARPDGNTSDPQPPPGLRWGARRTVESARLALGRLSVVAPPVPAPWTVRQSDSSAWWSWPPADPSAHGTTMFDMAVLAVGGSDGQRTLRTWAVRRRMPLLEVHFLASSGVGAPNGTETCDRIALPLDSGIEAAVEAVRMWRERRAGAVCAYVADVRPPAGGEPDPRLRTLRAWGCGAVAVALGSDLASLHAAAGLVGHLAVRRPGEGAQPLVAAWILGGGALLGTLAELQAALNAPCLIVD